MQLRSSRLYGMLAAHILLTPAPTVAQIWDNGTPVFGGAEITQWIGANDFVLGAPTTITGVRFWAFTCPRGEGEYSGSIFWQIFSDAGGSPGTSLFSGLVNPTVTSQGSQAATCGGPAPSIQYDFGINSTLGSGIFWLALHHGPLETVTRSEFYWQRANSSIGTGYMFDEAPFGTGGWGEIRRYETAFQLFGAPETVVPEPATVVLLASGLLGLAGVGYTRRRRG